MDPGAGTRRSAFSGGCRRQLQPPGEAPDRLFRFRLVRSRLRPDETGGGADCAAVLASPYSYWPPKKDDEPKGTGHLPVAFLGLVYFSALTVWLIGVGRPSRSRRWLHALPLLVIGIGLLGSARFLYIMFLMLDEWCPWCLVTHILNFLIFLLMVVMWPRVKKGAQPQVRAACAGDDAVLDDDLAGADAVHSPSSGEEPRGLTSAARERATGSAPLATRVDDSHPSGRMLLITVTAMFLIAFGQNEMLGKANFARLTREAKQGYDQCLQAVNRIKADSARLVKNWKIAEKHEFKIGPDDRMRSGAEPGEKTVQVVVFSDFECPSCKRLATFLEEKAQPLFDGHLKLIFKHYPLGSDCNGRVKKTVHKHACFAAAAAEAAYAMGGSDAFWQAHDYFFAQQNQLRRGKLTSETVAVELGLDPTAFREAMQAEQVAKKIWDDVNLARECSVKGTPALFVSGRQVDTLAHRVEGFWDRLADMYWRSTGKARPETTKLRKGRATPSTPGQPAAP